MTQLYRQTKWLDIDTLTASKLNLEFDTIVNTWNAQDSGMSKFTNIAVAGTSEFDGASTFYSTSLYGNSSVSGFTATATTGGTLSGGTYYYKVYPVFGSLIGAPSVEKSVLISGGNNATSLSWTAVPGVSGYRVSRGTSSGAQSGYYAVTTTSYTDTGSSFTGSGNAFSQSNSQWIAVGGNILMPASSGGIYFTDYVDGTIVGNIGITSAGEMQYQPGANGANKGVHFFQDYNQQGLIEFDRSGTHSEIAFFSGNSLIDGDLTFGSTLNIRPNNVTTQVFSSSALSMASTKITNLTNGSSSSDGAAYGQVKILQVVAATTGTGATTTSSSFAATSLTASITPVSASNKVLVMAIGALDITVANKSGLATITRGGTNVLSGTNYLAQVFSAGGEVVSSQTLIYLDAPSATTSQTYSVAIRNTDNATTVNWGGGSNTQVIILMEVQP